MSNPTYKYKEKTFSKKACRCAESEGKQTVVSKVPLQMYVISLL